MECWYQKGCNLYKPNCTKICHRFLEMNYLISNCGMTNADKYIKPLVPEKVDLTSFIRLKEIKDNIVEFVNSGENLYIVSENFGNGKTTWSLKLLYKYFDEIWCGNGFKIRGYFIYIPEFLSKIKMIDYRNSHEYRVISKILREADLVIWDDIASTKLTDSDHTYLCSFIDPRILKGKSNIFTGNLLDEDLKLALGNRLHNRIWDSSEIIKFVGRGRRN